MTPVEATHFDTGDYLPAETVEPYECMCEYTSDSPEVVKIKGIWVGSDSASGYYAMKAAATMPWHKTPAGVLLSEIASHSASTLEHVGTSGYFWRAFVEGDDDVFGGEDEAVVGTIEGAWRVYFPNRGFYNSSSPSPYPIECDAVDEEKMWIQVDVYPPTSSPTSLPIPKNPLDIDEDDLACSGTTPKTTGMRLVDLPGWTHPVAIGISGARQYGFAKMDSVSVSA